MKKISKANVVFIDLSNRLAFEYRIEMLDFLFSQIPFLSL
jgi:hypothetical protein